MNEFLYPALAGVVGGVTIAGVGMIYRTIVDGGFWTLPNGIGGIVLGAERGASRDFGLPTLTGVGLHMVLSAIYGIVIVLLAPRIGIGLVPMGLAVGIAVWLFNYYVVGAVHEGSRKLSQLNPVWMAFFLHALFGFVTAVVAQALIA